MPFSAARRAFTLVEILVVIGVLVLLSALAFPVFSRVRENGRRVSCQTNLQQLGIAFNQYIEDSAGKYPLAGVGQAWDPGKGHWVAGKKNEFIAGLTDPFDPVPDSTTPTGYKMADVQHGALFPYVKEAHYYICPSNKDGEKKGLSYSMNCAITELRKPLIQSPAEIVLLVDEEKANDGYFFAVDDTKAGSADTNSTDALTTRHNGGGNLLFTDGHVKFFSNKDFPLDDTPAGKANKWIETGPVRFHDVRFGPWGSNRASDSPALDYCNATKRLP